MIKGFNHASFTVRNIDRALEFWTKGLGFKSRSVSERTGDWQGRVTGVAGAKLKIAHLFGYGHHVELIEYLKSSLGASPPQPNVPGAAHVCLEVEDIQNTLATLIELGASAHGELVEVEDGPVKGSHAIYVRDPDGIIIELVEFPNELRNVVSS